MPMEAPFLTQGSPLVRVWWRFNALGGDAYGKSAHIAGQTKRKLDNGHRCALAAHDALLNCAVVASSSSLGEGLARTDQVSETRRVLREMNDAADLAIDGQVVRSTPMTPKK